MQLEVLLPSQFSHGGHIDRVFWHLPLRSPMVHQTIDTLLGDGRLGSCAIHDQSSP